jgi:hypothetical protein
MKIETKKIDDTLNINIEGFLPEDQKILGTIAAWLQKRYYGQSDVSIDGQFYYLVPVKASKVGFEFNLAPSPNHSSSSGTTFKEGMKAVVNFANQYKEIQSIPEWQAQVKKWGF